jgi:hypothetical protein
MPVYAPRRPQSIVYDARNVLAICAAFILVGSSATNILAPRAALFGGILTASTDRSVVIIHTRALNLSETAET